MKRLLCFLLLVFGFQLDAQVTYNKRVHFDYFAAVLTSIVPSDSCYVATGIVADTVPPFNTGAVFAKLDLDGNPAMVKTLTDTSKTFEPWFNSLTQIQDGSFMATAASFDPHENAVLLKYNSQGDTIFSRSYRNPQFPGFTRIQPGRGLTQLSDGGFIVPTWANSFSDPYSISNVYVIKVDSLGLIEWDSFYTSAPMRERPTSRVDDGNGNTWIGWTKNDQGFVTENLTYKIGIVKINDVGEALWEYASPDSLGLLDAPNDMALLEDGSLVIATGVGTELDEPLFNRVWFEKSLLKLNPTKEVEWKITFPDPDFNSQSQMTNVIEVSDGSGFVCAGQEGDLVDNIFHQIRGWIGKVNTNGEAIWTRAYVGIDNDLPHHKVYDLKETTDGGFILTGESRDGTADTFPVQQAWLLKLDQYGCLVPGCHLLDDAGEEFESELKLSIYPNPTSDYLNFQLRKKTYLQKGTFRMMDANGKTWKTFSTKVRQEDTYIVPVWEWPAGVYFLQYLEEENRLVVSEKFVVAR